MSRLLLKLIRQMIGTGLRLRPALAFISMAVGLLLILQPAIAQDRSANEIETVTLQLKWKHQFQFAGYYAADAQGFYEDAGLDVRIVEAQEAADPIETVVDGQAEFGVGTSELLLWRSQGKPVVILGVIFQHSPLVLLTTRASGIESLHSLMNRQVAIEPNSAELIAYLQNEGVNVDLISLHDHPFTPDGLIDGTVDAISAYSTDEPYVLQEAGIEYNTFSPRAAGIDFYGDVLFTTQDQIDQHPERVRAFVDASMRGWKYAFAHEGELIDYIYTQLTRRHTPDHLRFEADKMRALVLPDLIEPGYMYEGRWRHIAQTYAQVGLIPDDFSVVDMLYEPNTEFDPRPLYTGLVGVLGFAVVIGMVSMRFYSLNTRLRQQMNALQQAQGQLRESEERYRSLVESAPFPVLISSLTDSTVRYLNPPAETQLKLDRETALGKPVIDLYDDPDDRTRFLTTLAETGCVRDFDVYLRDSEGRRFWAAVSARRLTYEGQPAVFVTFVDMTERKRAEAQAFALAVEQERIKVLTAFIQNASHEFRTPLTVISSSVYLLSKSADDEKRRYHIAKVEAQIRLITRLVEMTATMAVLDSGAHMEFSQIDVNQFIHDVANAAVRNTPPGQMAFNIAVEQKPLLIEADANRLRQALNELVNNAIQHTASDGSITVRGWEQDGDAVIEVRDTGSGISDEALPHIFERFWRQDRVHTTPGFGLGLALVKRVVAAHHGRIEVESRPGVGSSFRMFLPVNHTRPVSKHVIAIRDTALDP